MNARKVESIFKITFWKVVAIILWTLAIYVAYVRFFKGLGYTTNLSDDFPWGLWIGFDVISGVGLAAGGFTITALVYIFNIKKFKPIVRSTVLTAFLGYVLVIIGLMFDLGKWYYVWHAIFYWNEHSVMFEVAWCVMLYTTVLFLEFTVNVFERMGWKKMVKIHHWLTPLLVTLGVMFSTLHQSSLGSLFLIEPTKLHPLWYTGWLPVLFFVYSIMVAFAMTIFESYMSARAFGRQLELDILREIGRVLVFMLVFYLVIRVETLWSEGAFKYLTQFSTETVMFLIEIIFGFVVPLIMLSSKKIRNDRTGLFFASLLVIFGFIMNRMNVTITGHQSAAGTYYFPSWMELVVTFALIALGFAVFGLAARYLPIFPEGPWEIVEKKIGAVPDQPRKPIVDLSYRTISIAGFLIIVGLIIVGVVVKEQKATYAQLNASVVQSGELNPDVLQARENVRLPADYVFPMAEDSPGPVTFSHESHYDYDNPNCGACHPGLFKMLEPGKAADGPVTMDSMSEGKNCGACHNGKVAFDAMDDENCGVCHQEQ